MLTHTKPSLHKQIDEMSSQIEADVIKWRRHFHQNPELSNREFKTSETVAEFLRSLGMEVKTKIGLTGVIGILKGGQPGPVIALRADMDALPITETTDVPFASKVKDIFNGRETGVMHACGHDAHMAMLMGAAKILSSVKEELKGTVKFIFQPAEEGPPEGEEGGAPLMIKEGALKNPDVDAIFGMHIRSDVKRDLLMYRAEGIMAGADVLKIKIKGRNAHGGTPWLGVDPITVSAQLILALQTIISRQSPLTDDAAILSIGAIHGGNRYNIIPDEVELLGTIRTFNKGMRKSIHEKVRRTTQHIAESAGATAEVIIDDVYNITYNDPALMEQMLPSLKKAAGEENTVHTKALTWSEDFSYFQENVPGVYIFIGGASPDAVNPPAHHTPDFFLDERSFQLGVRAFCHVAVDYLAANAR
jgi:amidohydrolase